MTKSSDVKNLMLASTEIYKIEELYHMKKERIFVLRKKFKKIRILLAKREKRTRNEILKRILNAIRIRKNDPSINSRQQMAEREQDSGTKNCNF